MRCELSRVRWADLSWHECFPGPTEVINRHVNSAWALEVLSSALAHIPFGMVLGRILAIPGCARRIFGSDWVLGREPFIREHSRLRSAAVDLPCLCSLGPSKSR